MKINYILIVFMLFSCAQKTKEKEDPIVNAQDDAELLANSPTKAANFSFENIIKELKTKTVPLVDSTNYDNFIEEKQPYSHEEISLLQLEKKYPNFFKDGYNFSATPNYKMELSKKFHSIVVTIFKGDSEMESVLINYDLKGELIDYKVISYDEIAEGWSRIESKIEKNKLTIKNILWIDEKEETIEIFKIDTIGKITPVVSTEENNIPSEFISKLRPNEKIELGKIYSDTVNYLKLNDEGDEWIFLVEKNKDTFGFINNRGQKNKFVRGDKIAIDWKMDSIRYAGDDEYLDFTTFLISSEKIKPLKLTDKKIKFLWRETQYNEDLNTDINTILINQNYIKTITEPEKAALGYIATFVGNECEWDGKPTESRNNLKCKIIWALGLRYQCSYKHLEYLKYWFRNNKDILKELENCRAKPDGATIQNSFDEINLEVSGNRISVSFKASGYNLREGESWNWTEKHVFEFAENELIGIKKEVSPMEKKTFELQEN